MIFHRGLCSAILAGCWCFAQVPSGQPQAGSGATFQAMVQDAKTRIREIGVPQLASLFQAEPAMVLIDVREDSEWQAGHAAKAIHIGRGVLERNIESAVPKKDARIVLYCHSGARSALAADTLQKMGYTKVLSLAGGFSSYQSAGLPTEK